MAKLVTRPLIVARDAVNTWKTSYIRSCRSSGKTVLRAISKQPDWRTFQRTGDFQTSWFFGQRSGIVSPKRSKCEYNQAPIRDPYGSEAIQACPGVLIPLGQPLQSACRTASAIGERTQQSGGRFGRLLNVLTDLLVTPELVRGLYSHGPKRGLLLLPDEFGQLHFETESGCPKRESGKFDRRQPSEPSLVSHGNGTLTHPAESH